MTTIQALSDAIRDAWASVPAPPVEELKYMAWGWGEAAAREFIGVAPMDVDRDSTGFSMAESLLDLPPRAGAAYLGSFLLSALEVLEREKSGRLFASFTYPAHIVSSLDLSFLWNASGLSSRLSAGRSGYRSPSTSLRSTRPSP